MIEMENKKEAVTFDYEGKTYCMSRDEIEAAYRFREQEYREADAEVAVQYFVFGSDDPEFMADEDYQQCITDFEQQWGIGYEDLVKSIPDIVGIFFCKQDCNMAENDIWTCAIEDQIARLKLAGE